jgi:LysR family transcriptional regulator, hydrogen peroxide-inducible genes activator
MSDGSPAPELNLSELFEQFQLETIDGLLVLVERVRTDRYTRCFSLRIGETSAPRVLQKSLHTKEARSAAQVLLRGTPAGTVRPVATVSSAQDGNTGRKGPRIFPVKGRYQAHGDQCAKRDWHPAARCKILAHGVSSAIKRSRLALSAGQLLSGAKRCWPAPAPPRPSAMRREIGAQLVERRSGEIALTETGLDVARRAEHILAAAHLIDFARHRDLLTGRLRFGIIPTLAPYVLPRVLPRLQSEYPSLRLEVRETQTKSLLEELTGELDTVMLAMPAEGGDLQTQSPFGDRFMLAVPASDPLPANRRVPIGAVDRRRLILLEEGHCLRDQALALCATTKNDAPAALGATSLATVMQMVANDYGVTLLPEIAAAVEVRDRRVKLLRFAEPEPSRVIGLAWRRTSPRGRDFEALGRIITETFGRAKGAMDHETSARRERALPADSAAAPRHRAQ